MYPFLSLSMMVQSSRGHKLSAILPVKHACASYKKLNELHRSETMLRRREKFLAPNGIHTPKVPTRSIDWENKRILNLWMEINGMHQGTTRTSAYNEYTNNEILYSATCGIMNQSREFRYTKGKYRPLKARRPQIFV